MASSTEGAGSSSAQAPDSQVNNNGLEGIHQNLLEAQKQILQFKCILDSSEVVDNDQLQQLSVSLTEMETDFGSLGTRLEYVREKFSKLSLEVEKLVSLRNEHGVAYNRIISVLFEMNIAADEVTHEALIAPYLTKDDISSATGGPTLGSQRAARAFSNAETQLTHFDEAYREFRRSFINVHESSEKLLFEKAEYAKEIEDLQKQIRELTIEVKKKIEIADQLPRKIADETQPQPVFEGVGDR
ncbi:unnamed protein product [Orchesella dallaii]|uniref:Uncharacterized protein n=1 Tax=Orchesella dallaii TaxID=48710 RepID=A0ABP1QJS2_9HEXA